MGSVWVLLMCLGVSFAWMDERPVLESKDGNLIISSAKNRNITLKVLGHGYVNVNDVNLLHVANAAQDATRLIERWRRGYLMEVENNVQRLSDLVEGPLGLQRRLALLEGLGDGNNTRITNKTNTQGSVFDPATRNGLRRVNDRIRRLDERVRMILSKLRENECQSNPCQNGGSCQDLYEGYQCHCTSSWEGPNCMADVNECVRYLGTDLGCQNGATCFNLPGSYRCGCRPGWFGLHCTAKTSICDTQNSEELCGHGVCVSKPSSALGYTCICDQGWESTDSSNPACTKDVDECAAKRPVCSVNPPVPCLNAPGTFFCGSCPPGYNGNGYFCSDVDECLIDNGGCSTTPRVQCINTMGSRICGACPPGYHGDGVSCAYVGACRINNGGCHPLAHCIDNPSMPSVYVQCRCPLGYQGDGMGPNGCQPSTDVSGNRGCASNPCIHGVCLDIASHGFVCHCTEGYSGPTCNVRVDPCNPNPCKNSGTCVAADNGVTCECTGSYTGPRCETQRQACGGVSREPSGLLEFPGSGKTYQHGLSCAWVVITNHSLVLNVSFTSFSLESSPDCKFDFLQIHDGRNAGSHMLGRFCGNHLPNDGIIFSSHNALYFWFHSDSSVSHDGFAFSWTSVEPVCGGSFVEDFGTITSPGFPGRYPANRDCYWRIYVRPGKRIQFHFGQLMLEEHPTCENDYVEITGDQEERIGIYCNHTRPAPLITPAMTAAVHFHSDSAGQDAGFQIHYSTVESTPGCGGVFTSLSGVIRSPGHSSSYEANLDCEWKIQLPVGERIKITWHKFDVEDSSRCHFDSVEVYDGPDRESPLIGRFCGDELPPTIKSNTNIVLVNFQTDWSLQNEGFALSFELLCGGEFTTETGILTSPLYPQNYHPSRTCLYEIIQPPGKGIILTIEDMEIEGRGPPDCYFDHLEIYDGDGENATKLATLCGEPEDIPDGPFHSTHNFMYLKFTTDSSVQYRGFKANYTTVDHRCGGLYRTPTGIIQPPLEDGRYANDEECTWTIQAPPGHVIQLTWLAFNLEQHSRCRNDYVNIYENAPNTTGSEMDLMGTYCGTRTPPVLTTQGRSMTINFRTDYSVTSDGFMATYIFLDATKVCGGRYMKSSGSIKSPNYPDKYPTRKECIWVIEAPNKQKVTLHVETFSLEAHDNCFFDYLEIRNGGYESSPLIGKYCGTEIPTTIVSQTNQMFVKFVSDSSRSGDGFSISWDNSLATGCGGNMNAASGDIISPNYPSPYSRNADCTWKISVATGNLVQVVLTDFDLEDHSRCRFDYVEIYEGHGNRGDDVRYCGTRHPNVITSSSNTITIHFRSDFTSAGRGFHIKYETICNNLVRGFWGVIESPSFPNRYQHSMNCSWTIEVPPGNRINISFSHFELEGHNTDDCQFDYLEIREGQQNVSNTELGRFCGAGTLPKKIHSTQNQVFLKFVTDRWLAFNGFRLEWFLDGCGGYMTKPSDTFTSPGYPGPYPESTSCEWLIEVDPMHSVEVTFQKVDTEKRVGCRFDVVTVYAGSDANAPKLFEVCHTEKPIVYTSPGHKMFVTFHADPSNSGRGFSATYKSVPIRCGGIFKTKTGTIHSANYPMNYPPSQNCEWLLEVDKNYVVNMTFEDFDIEDSRNCTDDYVKIFDGPTREYAELGTHCRNELPPSYISSGNQMLVVMRTDSIISAKGFQATYQQACGARIIVKDNGYLTPSRTVDGTTFETNCTWILVAEDPADHVTLTVTHSHFSARSYLEVPEERCAAEFVQVFEGEGIDGSVLAKWCTSKVPPPFTSTGNALTVHFYGDYDINAEFTAIYTSLNSACGGNYTSENGTIASPGYPNSYPLNAECIWILNSSPGNRIALTFSRFDLEESENCDLDYLEVREGNGIGKLVGTFCGKEIQAITSASTLWLKFKTDQAGTAGGFVGEYNVLGGSEVQGPIGEITSPLYPLPFRRSSTTEWRITVEVDSVIRIEFQEFYLDRLGTTCFSNVQIYDGYNNQAPALIDTCGLVIPDPVTTSSNIAFIVMHNKYMVQGNLFRLRWLQVPREMEDAAQKRIKISECSEEVALMDAANGTYSFNSPGWPNGYEHNLECYWVFTSPPGTHLVLRLPSMNLEEVGDCIADYVAVYSGYAVNETNDAHLEEKLCLSNSTRRVVRSSSNIMTVKFVTDSYVNKTGFQGFVFRDCGGKLYGPNGIIEINNMTSVRGVRTWQYTCIWVVEVRMGKTIQVNISELVIPENMNHLCGDSYLMIRNGGETTSPLLGAGKYCGDTPPPTFQTVGNLLYVKVSGRGQNVRFKLNYREVNTDCGGDFITRPGQMEIVISSPNYPNIPPPFAECFWRIIAPSGERVSIHFVGRFDLTTSTDCAKEYVEIRDGATEDSKSLGRFCKDTAPSSLTTSGNMMYVHFFTEVHEPKNGFKAEVVSGQVCGGIIRGTSGIVRSPNYPHAYPQDQMCAWRLIAPIDHTLKIEFRDIHLPSLRRCESTDHVEISETILGNDTTSTIGVYCGSRKPAIIETSINEALVTFKSDHRAYTSYRGFALNFTSSQETCGGELTALEGIIKSPGYPNPRVRSRYCDWRIKLPREYQVVVDILDMDAGGTGSARVGYSISFYNDFRFKSRIKIIGQVYSTQQIRSSSNTMMIAYWSATGHRGFKLRYSANAPAPCGGELTALQGTITGPRERPFNESTFSCQWAINLPESMVTPDTQATLTLKASGLISLGDARPGARHCVYPQYISLTDIGMICGNLTAPRYLRSPKLSNVLTILNATYGRPMNFHLEYKWQMCGGILRGPRHRVTAPKNISYPINCAWHVNYPSTGETVTLNFARLNVGNCDTGYIIIRHGGPMSPEVGKFCGNIKPDNITSTSNQLWIEYYAAGDPNDFEFTVDQISHSCGGALRGPMKEIASPEFPKQYPNNAECTWEIMVDNGFHIGLTFVDRFNLETSTNCEKDYLQIMDWVPAANSDGGSWKELAKVCGRNTPNPFNSTSNRMKVIFRSNDAIQADGFRAIWNENCGGVMEVTDDIKYIHSPSYPNYYRPNMFCNYTLVAPERDIIVEFTDFHVERGRGDCRFDNVTITGQTHRNMYGSPEESTYCGEDKPPLMKSVDKMEIIFRTDKYIQKSGFRIQYYLNNCGGLVTTPRDIVPLMNNNEYFAHMNCTWIVRAPSEKSVVLRFEKFIVEMSSACYFDYLEVSDGVSGQKLGRVCGNLTDHLPVFKTDSNTMVITFYSDSSRNYDGFIGKILFANGPATGCGGVRNLTTVQSDNFRTQGSATYEPFEDCHWNVLTSSGKNLRFTITSMDLKITNNTANATEKCNGDFIEVREGSGPFSLLLGKFCGSVPPPPLMSSSNALWIRFYTDGTNEGTGVVGRLEAIDSLCGVTNREVNETTHVLTSPGYPNHHAAGIRCRWSLHMANQYSEKLLIRFLDFDMAASAKCTDNYVEISDRATTNYIEEGFGEELIFNGGQLYPIHVEIGSRQPLSSYKYCGGVMPHDYYSSYTSNVDITFASTTSGHKGFKLEYSLVSCNRNYTGEQGRIVHKGFTDCRVTIEAPKNHTISLYFNEFKIYDNHECTQSALEIREGGFSGSVLGTFCELTLPNPIFSTGNKLSLHSWSERGYSYESYDIIFTTTDKGRGCGGRIFNYGGRFTSPMYPNPYRNNTVCTWDVSVPQGSKIIVEFNVFDIGARQHCDLNYLQIYDALPNNERSLRSTYCGGDDPARFEAEGNRIFVTYTSTVNNVGSGWVIIFMAQSTSNPVLLGGY